MRQQLLSLALAGFLCFGMTAPAFAAEQPAEMEAAGAFLCERGVYQVDSSGDLMLDKGLTRAEMAAILTRLHGEGEVNPDYYAWACYFTDVPEWARPYVGYCTANLLVSGYDASRYGPNDSVTPAMACTVVLRCCGYEDGEGSEWTYSTACNYAVSLGLISQSTALASVITRGEMAVLIYHALRQNEDVSQPPIMTVPSPGAYQNTSGGGVVISQDSWSREDYSQKANPSVFTGPYTRDLYNAIRQTIVDGTSETPAYTMVSKGDYSAVHRMVGRMDGLFRYEHYVPKNLTNYYEYLDYYALSAQMPEIYQSAYDFIQPVIDMAGRLGSDREKVKYLNDYLCSLMTNDRKSVAGIVRTFAPHSEELKGACGDYTHNFKFLCGAVGIPCITVSTANHSWNLVYADRRWLHVDVAANDLYQQDYILLTEAVSDRVDQMPEATAFLKELLVPGSTT